MTLSTVATVASSAVLALGLGAAPAESAPHHNDAGGSATAASPWIPYEQPDITIPAGRGCDFEVFEQVLMDDEYYRNVATYPDGTPRTQQWKGPLVMSFTNTETGDSVVRDLTGRATIEYGPDGVMTSITSQNGHFGSTMPAGSNVTRGVYVMAGRGTSVTFNADDTRTLELGRHGSAENLCPLLDGDPDAD